MQSVESNRIHGSLTIYISYFPVFHLASISRTGMVLLIMLAASSVIKNNPELHLAIFISKRYQRQYRWNYNCIVFSI